MGKKQLIAILILLTAFCTSCNQLQFLHPSPSPTPSPTAMGGGSGWIAFSDEIDGNRDVYIMQADGSNKIRLTDNAASDWNPVWSPDGNQIAFLSTRDNVTQIYLMNVDGSNQRRLTNTQSNLGYPAWSPDGKSIAYVSYGDEADPGICGTSTPECNTNIYLINTNTLNETHLTDTTFYDEGPSWSPDGNQIVFFSNREGDAEIYVMNSDGSNVTRITFNGADDWHPVWSPVGGYIAFLSNRDGNYEVYRMNTDGSNVTRLTNNNVFDSAPSWSPDGQHIAFNSSYPNGNSKVCIMGYDGSNLTCLSNLTNPWEPTWQPYSPALSNLPTSALASTSVPVKNTVMPTETRTPTPAPTSIPASHNPTTVGDFTFQITEVRIADTLNNLNLPGEYVSNYKGDLKMTGNGFVPVDAKSGDKLLLVFALLQSDNFQSFIDSNLKIIVEDSEVETVAILTQEENKIVIWVYDVSPTSKSFLLVFPGDVRLNLAPITP